MIDYEKCKHYESRDVTSWHGDVFDHPIYKCYCHRDGKERELIYSEGQCKRCMAAGKDSIPK